MSTKKNSLRFIITLSLIILSSLSLGLFALTQWKELGEQKIISQQQNISLENMLKGYKKQEQFVYESQEESSKSTQPGGQGERKTQAGGEELILDVRKLRKTGDLQNRFIDVFPEIALSNWGVIEVYNEALDIGLEYLVVPLWFNEIFIIDHQNSKSYEFQKDILHEKDSLSRFSVALKDRVKKLKREISEAYKAGYDSAYVKYEALNEKYIRLLEKR